ncbi:MAG: tetratricopeptide repeat protein [Bacteroidetes bacterium]|nr:tetratricopeptide repeat protein [Bacteroidota bacterium]
MKKTFIAILLSAVTLTAPAQLITYQQFQKQLINHPQQDTFYVNYINYFLSQDNITNIISPLHADSLAFLALTVAKKLNYIRGIVRSTMNVAAIKFYLGETQQSFNWAQQADSMVIKNGYTDMKANIFMLMGTIESDINPSESLNYFLKADSIAENLQNKFLLALCQRHLGFIYVYRLANYPKAIDWLHKAIENAQQANNITFLKTAWGYMGYAYSQVGDHETALTYYIKAQQAADSLGFVDGNLENNIGEDYRLSGKYPQAIAAYWKALAIEKNPGNTAIFKSNLADVYVKINDLSNAFSYAFAALPFFQKYNVVDGVAWAENILARAYLKKDMIDSALFYSSHGLQAAQQSNTLEYLRDNTQTLSDAYAQKKDFGNAYHYYLQYIIYRDSMNNAEIRNKAGLMQYQFHKEKTDAQIAALNVEKKNQHNMLMIVLGVLGLIVIGSILLLRNIRQKQKANSQLQKTLVDLKSTQAQLIQSEKMASLGELTAGIAHEIQNPLNFVNNFSEVNKEMLEELKAERVKSNTERDEALQDELINDVIENSEKINHHGQRAAAIVKGMLQHSRASSGKKEPTDINALCNEYLRLSYHGMRAKDKDFNCEMKTDFDNSIGKINIAPQDIGRVILNLINNAFYAVNEKKKQSSNSYQPTAKIITRRISDTVEIRVIDNGNGIPEKIKDKIFQPFFTTKPTGSGTGLGLSLSYDIVKAHGGEINVNTEENEALPDDTVGWGTEFIIQLPL